MKSNNYEIGSYKSITIFPGLNALRFLAAFLVVMHHSEIIKAKNGIGSLKNWGLFDNGGNAVTFFFVLSGFLITYLLLKENAKTNTIKIKNFYFKRILRIWPLYYLLVIIGTIVLPLAFSIFHIEYEMPYTLQNTWYYFVFFLPGLVTFYFGHHFLEPLWSIGVEEVFYLIWAPLFKLFKKHLFLLLIAIILLKGILVYIGLYFYQDKLFNFLVGMLQFEAMAVGGLGAYFIYNAKRLVSQNILFKMPFQILVFSIVITFLLFHANIDNPIWNLMFKTQFVSSLILDFLFLYIIICVAVAENGFIKFKNKVLSFLGEISYGIYMYHILSIYIVIFLLKKSLIDMSAPFNHIAFYFAVVIVTITISILSKKLFENYFLKLKDKLK